ncbi:MAG: alpha-L-rhamnosidase N-terminal domain-containing protein [Bifidobacterium pseudocatenulatum]
MAVTQLLAIVLPYSRNEVEYADGSMPYIPTWTATAGDAGPIVCSDLCEGERYDARLEQPGW